MIVNRFLMAALLMLSMPGWGQSDDLDAELQAARDRLDEAARELADLQRRRGPPAGLTMHRVPLPMSLGLFLGRPHESGIEVLGVTPEGPAAAAGIEAGDVITAIAGQPFDSSDRASIRLAHRRVAELGPGEEASIDYLRDDQLYSTNVAVRAPEQAYQWLGDGPQGGSGVARATSTLVAADVTAFGGHGPGIALHEVNPELGRYFGVEAGLLVLEGGDDPEKLMPGDVVTQVNDTPIRHRMELFKGLRAEARNVTVIRDGGTVALMLGQDDVMGGVVSTHMGTRMASPVSGGSLQIMDIRSGDGQDVEVLVNGTPSAPAP